MEGVFTRLLFPHQKQVQSLSVYSPCRIIEVCETSYMGVL